ncbi:TraX family protein [Lachnospiraceae bacterium LCP25S3_G4]
MEAIRAKKGLTANSIKTLAIIAMLIDHIAWAFVPTDSLLGIVMHLIGRITAPIMCYFIAEGYYYTRDVKKYAFRLFMFAVISYLPFIYFETGALPTITTMFMFNMIFTLWLGLIALWIQDREKVKIFRICLLIVICMIATLGDWLFFAIWFILAFGMHRGNFKKQILWFCIATGVMIGMFAIPYLIVVISSNSGMVSEMQVPTFLEFFGQIGIQIGVLLALPLLATYNGKRGGGPYSKWLFYIFYPAHLVILGLIKWGI